MSKTTAEIGPETPMGELLARFPGAQRALFARYHIGGCRSCGFRPDETLAEVCARNENLPVEEVVDHIVASADADARLEIPPRELAERLSGEAPPRLLDVRTREEFEAVRLPDSRLMTQETIEEIFSSWDRESAVVVYDHQGVRALDAAAYLIGHGFANTRALRGGIDAYSIEADPSLPRYRIELDEEATTPSP